MKKHLWWIVLVVIIVVFGSFAYFHKAGGTPTKEEAQTALSELNSGQAPWPAEIEHLKARLTAINLPALAEEGTVLHIHQHLDIFVHGQSVAVPSGIGINETAGFISPIHVHDTTGIIHVESPTVLKFTFGEFFDIWGVKLTDTCMGGYCTDATNQLTFYVNGTKYVGDPRALELTAHEEIVAVYGTASETPATLPTSFTFPAGY